MCAKALHVGWPLASFVRSATSHELVDNSLMDLSWRAERVRVGGCHDLGGEVAPEKAEAGVLTIHQQMRMYQIICDDIKLRQVIQNIITLRLDVFGDEF